MEQLILHLLGDFVLQNDWMANNKCRRSLRHALSRRRLLDPIPAHWFAGGGGGDLRHSLLHRSLTGSCATSIWARNCIGRRNVQPWSECSVTGFHKSTPEWLATWLMIIIDGTLHLICNYCALRWL
jgi:hypothetical protein